MRAARSHSGKPTQAPSSDRARLWRRNAPGQPRPAPWAPPFLPLRPPSPASSGGNREPPEEQTGALWAKRLVHPCAHPPLPSGALDCPPPQTQPCGDRQRRLQVLCGAASPWARRTGTGRAVDPRCPPAATPQRWEGACLVPGQEGQGPGDTRGAVGDPATRRGGVCARRPVGGLERPCVIR